jgi:hypothetical protein
MIAPTQALPSIQWRDTRTIPLSVGWLAESLDASAERAGQSNWDHSVDIARAISHYLESEYDGRVLTTDQLVEIIRRSLHGVGCDHIARRATLVPPRVNIHLPELARASEYELLFFPLLRERLNEALDVVVRGVRLEGLRNCVKILQQSRSWKDRCQRLNDEIVLFSRQQLRRSNPTPIDLMIC